MDMKVRFCYVGHGAMAYIQVYDRTGHVTAHLLVDAGSTDDKTDGSLRERNLDFVSEEISSYPAPMYVFITHFHEDHYNLLNQLNIPKDMTGHLYVGSIRGENEFDDPENELRIFWNLHSRMRRVIIPQTTIPMELLTLDNVQVYCLWNNYFTRLTDQMVCRKYQRACTGDSHRNENGAAFALICDGDAVVFSGDMTGRNFRELLGNSWFQADVKKHLDGRTVYMTVPHHGSLHTLTEPEWYPLLSLNKWSGFFDTSRLRMIIQNVFQRPEKMYISAGEEDRFNHPNDVAALAYDSGGDKRRAFLTQYPASHEVGSTNYQTNYNYDVKFTYPWGRPATTSWGTLRISKGNTVSLLCTPEGYEELIF